MPPDEFDTTGSLAKKLGVDRTTVHYWVSTGKLRPTQTINGIRLFDKATVDQFLSARKAAGAAS